MKNLKKAIEKVALRSYYTKRAMEDVDTIIETLSNKLKQPFSDCLINSDIELDCTWGTHDSYGSWSETEGIAYFQYRDGVLRLLKKTECIGYHSYRDNIIYVMRIDFKKFSKAVSEILCKISNLNDNESLANDASELLKKLS